MTQCDNHPNPKIQQGRHRQELAPNQPTVRSDQNAGKPPAAHNTDTHPFPPCSTCIVPSTITASYSRKKPAQGIALVVLHLTAAFNNVDHQQLLNCIFNTNIPQQSVAGSTTICRIEQAKVHFLQQESKSRKVKTGVVQGGVLSPALFHYYLADFPTPPPKIKLIKYADDITIYTSGTVVADLINGLNIYLSQVLNYINNK